MQNIFLVVSHNISRQKKTKIIASHVASDFALTGYFSFRLIETELLVDSYQPELVRELRTLRLVLTDHLHVNQCYTMYS